MMNAFLSEMFVKANAMLDEAQKKYGAKDNSWNFSGVVFQQDGPHIWYPTCDEGNEIQIALNPCSIDFPDQTLYQIAHEVIHILAPNPCPPTIMLEEAVAVYFSIHAPSFKSEAYVEAAINHLYEKDGPVNYRVAYDLYCELISYDQGAIIKLRKDLPEFYKMTPEYIITKLGVTTDFAERLCERRVMR